MEWKSKSPVLHAIIPLTNPIRFKSRYKLHDQFMARMKGAQERLKLNPLGPQLELYVVEIAFGDRPFYCQDAKLRGRTENEIWVKENMINLMAQRFPEDWQYVAWIDNDVEFLEPDFVERTIHALQHYHVVQMWEDAIDTGPNGEFVASHKAFTKQYLSGAKIGYGQYYGGYEGAHPGYAWAATRFFWDSVGGLFNGILGAGDNHMAYSLIGRGTESVNPKVTKEYIDEIAAWQARAEYHIKRDIGFVPGTIRHYWHGKKKDRRYWDRWQILVRNKFNPKTDLKHDWQGVLELEEMTSRQRQLRDDIRAYFRLRHEDSIDLE